MGEWRAQRVDWSRPAAVACRLCGRPLYGRVWSSDAGGTRSDFCDSDCETIFREYWLPRYGEAAERKD